MSFGSPGVFPMPASGGPQYLYFRQMQPGYEEITDRHDYDDGGASFVLRNDTAPIIFVLKYDGLSVAEAATLYAHRADAFGEAFGFSLTNPRTSQTYTNVHYAPDGWKEDHTKTWINSLEITLIWRPV